MATSRFCSVPKRRSILPLACGLGATRWVTPRAEKARWNSEHGSRSSAMESWPKRLSAVGVDHHGQGVPEKEAAKVLEMIPSGVGGDKNRAQEFAGMVVHRQQQ